VTAEPAAAGAVVPPPAGRWDRRAPYLLAAAAFVLYATYSVLRQLTYLTAGYDLGIFDQALRAYSRFQPPDVPLKGLDYNLLGDHFHPILALLAPLYWVWSDPRTLLLAQSALLAVSALPVWWFVRRRLTPLQSVMVVVGYLLCWPLQGMVDFDFHEVAFAVPILAFLIDALDRRAYRWVVALCFLLLLVREDMGALVLMVALIVLLRKKFWLAGGLALLGAVGYLAATSWVIPTFAATGTFAYWTYDSLGPNLPAALAHVVRDPVDTVREFLTPATKTYTLLWTFGATTLFLSLFSPYVLLTLPILAERMFSSREALWTTEFHYTAVLAPVLFLGAVDVLARLRDRFGLGPRWITGWAAVVVAIPLVGSLLLQAQFPLGRLVTGQAWQQSARSESLARILPLIPDGVCVAADDRAVPQLTHRTYVTNPGIPSPPLTWVLLDLSQDETGYLGPDPRDYLRTATAEGFLPVARDGSIVLLHRPGPVDPRCAAYAP
jgi:uncharacterized membrane protein